MTEINLPTTSELRDALLKVLASSPAGMTTAEIDTAVAQFLELTPSQLGILRSGTRSEFAYRLAWERTHAKAKGLIVRTGTRTWKIV